ncbi:cellulose binding domain-containing protein [Dactylosporangium vinaceum]|uniref:Cellulose binding domain-containing protein n=1 Tax=Dactylosporangium vinaceum TaxID=53362 RepID=A0ABV5MJN6_9ACTN|nr:cellulose binding domain-containing protein [Dactylosporangium vinaceum]UAB92644.1 cellulose binding domain-containing protein [Dactylosporangium vinaceum]
MKLKALAALLALAPASAFATAAPAAADPTPAPTCTAQVIPFAPQFLTVVTVRNNATAPFTGWSVTFELPATATAGMVFGGTLTRAGSTGTITPAPWFVSLNPGVAANVGFSGSAVPFTLPTDIRLNGVPCGPSGR